jgi:hypothetical protein
LVALPHGTLNVGEFSGAANGSDDKKTFPGRKIFSKTTGGTRYSAFRQAWRTLSATWRTGQDAVEEDGGCRM